MQEMEDLREEEQEQEEAEEVVKKSKFKGGLSGEVKALVERFEKRAKELGKNLEITFYLEKMLGELEEKNEK